MLVILAIAAIAILACVVLVSLGKGGELTEFPPDVPPLDLPEPGQLTAVDFMALQLPVNLVGYHTASVDETLRRAASAISARDTRIAVLEQRVSELLSSRLHARQEVYAAPGTGLRTDHSPDAPALARELPESGDAMSVSGAAVSWDGGVELTHPPEEAEWRLPAPDGLATANGELVTHRPAPRAENGDQAAEDDEFKPADEPGTADEPHDAAGAPAETEQPAEIEQSRDAEQPTEAEKADADENADVGDKAGAEAEEREQPARASSGKDGDARP